MIFSVAYRVVSGQGADDSRSGDEDECVCSTRCAVRADSVPPFVATTTSRKSDDRHIANGRTDGRTTVL
jgi:hypothetical protein